MSNASAKGHAKNAKNMLSTLLNHCRHDDPIEEDEVVYALEEVRAAIEEIE